MLFEGLFEGFGFRVSENLHGRSMHVRRVGRFAFEKRKQIQNRCRLGTGGLGWLKKGSLCFGGARRIKKYGRGFSWLFHRGNHGHFRNGVQDGSRRNWDNRWRGRRRG